MLKGESWINEPLFFFFLNISFKNFGVFMPYDEDFPKKSKPFNVNILPRKPLDQQYVWPWEPFKLWQCLSVLYMTSTPLMY